MNTRTVARTTTSLVAAAALAACQSQPVGTSPAPPDAVAAANYPTVSVERTLQPYVAVAYDAIIAQAPTAATPLTVQVPIRSTAANQFLIQYQFTWFDANGMQTGQTAWTMLAMEPGMRRTVKANANDAQSQRWLLEIRSSR